MARVIYYKVPSNLIGGPYAVAVIREDGSHTGTKTSGLRTVEAARQRAADYAASFGTSDISEVSI